MDMLVKLYDLPNSQAAFERLHETGCVVRRALAPEKHKVVAWVRDTFSEAWASEAEVGFSRQPISCFIAIQKRKIVGFACHDVTCLNFFGPTGTEPATLLGAECDWRCRDFRDLLLRRISSGSDSGLDFAGIRARASG